MRKSRRGFTLVEVLVALTVAALLITGVLSVTNAIVRIAARQKEEASREDRVSRAVELLRQDFRGRVQVARVVPPPPVGTRALLLTSTSDGILRELPRAAKRVVYAASERGLVRREGAEEILLLEGPALLEFWEGTAWRPEPDGPVSAIRLTGPGGGLSCVVR